MNQTLTASSQNAYSGSDIISVGPMIFGAILILAILGLLITKPKILTRLLGGISILILVFGLMLGIGLFLAVSNEVGEAALNIQLEHLIVLFVCVGGIYTIGYIGEKLNTTPEFGENEKDGEEVREVRQEPL